MNDREIYLIAQSAFHREASLRCNLEARKDKEYPSYDRVAFRELASTHKGIADYWDHQRQMEFGR